MGDTKIGSILTEDKIHDWDTDTKLTYIISVLISIATEIKTQSKTIYGNGDVGLCEKTRRNEAMVKVLWAAFSALGSIFAVTLVQHILSK